MKPDERTQALIRSFQGSPAHLALVEWLGSELQSLYVNGSHTKDEVLVRWNQGKAQVLQDLIHALNK